MKMRYTKCVVCKEIFISDGLHTCPVCMAKGVDPLTAIFDNLPDDFNDIFDNFSASKEKE